VQITEAARRASAFCVCSAMGDSFEEIEIAVRLSAQATVMLGRPAFE
jgi:hypothetical protein